MFNTQFHLVDLIIDRNLPSIPNFISLYHNLDWLIHTAIRFPINNETTVQFLLVFDLSLYQWMLDKSRINYTIPIFESNKNLFQSYQRPPHRGSFIWSIKLCYLKRLRYGSQSKIMINARSTNATINVLSK
jgi:hypothetical protein